MGADALCKLKLAECQNLEADRQWQQKLADVKQDLCTCKNELNCNISEHADALAQRDAQINTVRTDALCKLKLAECQNAEVEKQWQQKLAEVKQDLNIYKTELNHNISEH